MKNIIKIYSVISFLTFSILLAASIFIFFARGEEDVSVLLNGDLEYSYDATVFILREDYRGQVTVCGGTQIETGVIVTAAHCVENAKNIKVGKESIDLRDGDIAIVDDVLIKEGWEGLEDGWEIDKIVDDLAVISYKQDDIKDNIKSSIIPVRTGCNYTIVGFGTRYGEDIITLDEPRQKESLDVCIDSFDNSLMLIKPKTSEGFCFGDSGSPVYKSGTNDVVGILSSTIGNSEAELCDLDNRALAVRLDKNQDFIETATGDLTVNFTEDDVLAEDEANSDPFEEELSDLLEEYNWDESDYNLYDDEDELDSDFLDDDYTGVSNDNDSDEKVSKDNDSIFDLSSFASVPDEVFYVAFGIFGFNLFLSMVILAWSFKKTKVTVATNTVSGTPIPFYN